MPGLRNDPLTAALSYGMFAGASSITGIPGYGSSTRYDYWPVVSGLLLSVITDNQKLLAY
jgi:hypothetical protein